MSAVDADMEQEPTQQCGILQNSGDLEIQVDSESRKEEAFEIREKGNKVEEQVKMKPRERKQTEHGQHYSANMKERFAVTFMKQYEEWKELTATTKQLFKGYMTHKDVETHVRTHNKFLEKIR